MHVDSLSMTEGCFQQLLSGFTLSAAQSGGSFPASVSQRLSSPDLSMKMMPEFPFAVPDRLLSIADLLAEQGWAVAESGLAPEVLDQLERNCRALWQDEALRPAAVGRAGERQVVPEIRGDHIRWLDDCPPCAAQDAYVEAMARLRLTLNRTLLLGLDNYETHYALYPPGAGYSRHLDRFKDNPLRGVVLEPVQMPAVTSPQRVQGVMGLVIVQTQQQGAV